MWYIMSYNQIRGFVAGDFAQIDNLFFKDVEMEGVGTSCKWTDLVGEARPFQTFEAAQEFSRNLWGMRFSDDYHMIVFYKNVDEAMEQHAREGRARRRAKLLKRG